MRLLFAVCLLSCAAALGAAYSVVSLGEMWGTGETVLRTSIVGDGFCFLVYGRCWYKSGETCQIGTDYYGHWEMYTTSGMTDFAASFQCVNGLPAGNFSMIAENETGQGTWGYSLMSSDTGFCWISRGGAWHGDTEHCHVYLSGGYWTYSAASQQDGFMCGVDCVSGLEDYYITNEVVLSGTGAQSATLVYDAGPDVFCFITYGQQWYNSGESCAVAKYNGDWTLSSTSGMGLFQCGARCVYSMDFN